MSKDIVRHFQSQAANLTKVKNRNRKDQDWLDDYILHHDQLMDAYKSDDESVVSKVNLFEDGNDTVIKYRSIPQVVPVPAIKLNELVKKPEVFDGIRPPPRKWIDDFEKASEANGWTEQQQSKYFSTFLEKSGNDWFVTRSRKQLGRDETWKNLKKIFIKYWVGDSEKQTLRRQINSTFQGEREKVTTFIPRILRLVELCDADKTEEELVDMIRSKLKMEYQDKLVLCTTNTIDELNDACIKIENSIDKKKPVNKMDKSKFKPKGREKMREKGKGEKRNREE